MPRGTKGLVTRTVDQCFRCATLFVFVEGLRERNLNAVVNAAFMFTATYLPDIAEGKYNIDFQPWQRAYTEMTMLAHAVGFLGPYDDIWWWDHLTHTLSATLLGGFVHVAAHRRDRSPKRDVLTAIVGGSLLWESMEYAIHGLSNRLGIEPVLVYYGPRDTLGDLLFNLLGALLVIVLGDRFLQNFIRNID